MIINKLIHTVPAWQPATAAGTAAVLPGETAVWRVYIPVARRWCEPRLTLLEPAELHKARHYKRQDDYYRFVTGRITLKLLLAAYLGLTPAAVTILQEGTGKPYSTHPLCFNVAHSGDWVLLAFAGTPVGIDVEYLQPSFEYELLLEDIFHEREISSIYKSESRINRFYQLWTAKEAWFKRSGEGVTGNLAAENMLLRDDVVCFSVDDVHTGSVAFTGSTGSVRYFDFKFA